MVEVESLDATNPAAIAARLTRAVVTIGESSKSTLRAITDRYLQCIHPSLADRADSEFPRTVRRHPVDPNRSQIGGYGNVLSFLIGNAILTYYDLVRDEPAEHLLVRVKHLEEIAADPGAVQVHGNDREGYTLLTLEAIEGLNKVHDDDIPDQRPVPEEDGQPNG